jgi:hypothetical protein
MTDMGEVGRTATSQQQQRSKGAGLSDEVGAGRRPPLQIAVAGCKYGTIFSVALASTLKDENVGRHKPPLH